MEPFTAVFIEDGEWIGSWVDQVPGAVAQERTFEEGRESLREALNDVLAANLELASLAPG